MTEVVNDAVVATLVTRISNEGVEAAAFTSWLVTTMLSAAEFPGFWSGEIVPPTHSEPFVWQLVERFRSIDQVTAWKNSEIRTQLLDQMGTAPTARAQVLSQNLSTKEASGLVATAIVTHVRAGMESQYWEWERKIQTTQAKFPGYAGVYLQPPPPGKEGQWSKLLKFDKPDSLEHWFASDERQKLLAEADQFVKKTLYETVASSFPGWFPVDASTGRPPPKWKTAMIVFVGLFPTIIVLQHFLLPHLSHFPHQVATAINCVTSVSIVTWVTVPLIIKGFKWWLMPSTTNKSTVWLGLGGIFCLFLSEFAILWLLLR